MSCPYARMWILVNAHAYDVTIDRCWPEPTWFCCWQGPCTDVFAYGKSPEEAAEQMARTIEERYPQSGIPVTETSFGDDTP